MRFWPRRRDTPPAPPPPIRISRGAALAAINQGARDIYARELARQINPQLPPGEYVAVNATVDMQIDFDPIAPISGREVIWED